MTTPSRLRRTACTGASATPRLLGSAKGMWSWNTTTAITGWQRGIWTVTGIGTSPSPPAALPPSRVSRSWKTSTQAGTTSASDSRAPPPTDPPLGRASKSILMAKSATMKSIAAKGTAVPVRSTSMSVWALQPAWTPLWCAGPPGNTLRTGHLPQTASMRCWSRVQNRG